MLFFCAESAKYSQATREDESAGEIILYYLHELAHKTLQSTVRVKDVESRKMC